MKIVHILKGKANPETLNGVNRVVHWMATSQTRLGHEVEVWGLAESMTPPPQERVYRLRLFPLTRLRVTLGQGIRTALDRLEADAWVQFHSVFIPEYPAIARLLKRRGQAYGITPHGGYARGVLARNRWRKSVYIACREARYLRGAAWVQAIGESEIQDLRKLSPGARVVLIPNGQEPLKAPWAEPVGAERPLFGYCGRLAMKSKGLDLLIAGFADYKAKGGTGELWLIGDGEDRARLERQAEESCARSHMRFFGARYGEEKLKFLAGFDVFLHSSRWEGIPTTCLEAAALGRPLVVSRETNLAGYVERGAAGLVLEETSVAGVSNALDRVRLLYESHRLEGIGQNACSLIAKDFSWGKNARSFAAAIAVSNHVV
ncbi:MAG: glycosyltransferase family 4 protein [Terracidiphilus sp.]